MDKDIINCLDTKNKKQKIIGWHLFEPRQRYIKTESGDMYKTESGESFKYYERLFTGRLASKISGCKDLIKQSKVEKDSVVYVLLQGCTCDILESQNNIVKNYKVNQNYILIFDKDKNIIYANKHNKTSANDYVIFLQNESKANIEYVDLPYVIHTRKTGGIKITDLESAIASASANDFDI